MEDCLSSSRTTGRALAELASSLAQGRARAQQAIAAQRERWRQIDEQIGRQLAQLSEELRHDRATLDDQQAELLEQAGQIDRRRVALETDQEEWERLQDEATAQQQALAEFLQKQQDELNRRENALDAEEAQLLQVQEKLDASQRELDEQIEQLSQVRKRVDEKLATLEREREQVEAQSQDTKSQRRRIARQLQEQRAAQQRELQSERETLEQERAALALEREQLAAQLAEVGGASHTAQAEIDELTAQRDATQAKLAKVGADFASQKAEFAQAKAKFAQTQDALLAAQSERDLATGELELAREETRSARGELAAVSGELEQLQAELDAARLAVEQAAGAGQAEFEANWQKRLEEVERKFELAAEEASDLRRRNAELEDKLAQRPEGPNQSEVAQIVRLTEERDALVERLAEAEAKAKKGAAPADVQQKLQDLQRRFEMAVEDVRELKTANADLEKQLKAAKNAARPADTPAGGNLDWEAQKRKLLAALESEIDEDDEDARQERLSIEGAIQITDEVVADKQREIDELQRLLEEQSSQMGGMAIGAAAIAATLDQDELIQRERRRLNDLQAEWEEKLRRAEIEISVERAKMARERAALEEQITEVKELQKSATPANPAKADETGKKSPGGRWLARLGLKDGGEEKS